MIELVSWFHPGFSFTHLTAPTVCFPFRSFHGLVLHQLSPAKWNVWHLWCHCQTQLLSPRSQQYTREGVFNFVLARCLRRPLFTKCGGEFLPLQRVLGLGLPQLWGIGRSGTKRWHGLHTHIFLLFNMLCFGKANHQHCFFIQRVDDGVTRGPLCRENYCFIVLKFYFVLLWVFHTEQQKTFSMCVINTKPSFGHKSFLFHFPVRVRFHYIGFSCRKICLFIIRLHRQ